MIISASRRTDIPCFYMDWFLDKIKQGFVYSKNPFNRKQIKKITLNTDNIQCIVFWTKNPIDFILNMEKIRDFNYYFQYTINAYESDIETNLPDLDNRIKTFIDLSKKIGKDRIVWRYDPILFTEKYDEKFHINSFSFIAKKLQNYTDECIFSFVTPYKKIQKKLKTIGYFEKDKTNLQTFAMILKKICDNNKITLKNCCNNIQNIKKAACIDKKRIEKISGKHIEMLSDKYQRESCNCIKSVDIGEYNTCLNQCLYCYANSNNKNAIKNHQEYNIFDPILCYKLKGDEIIKDVKK